MLAKTSTQLSRKTILDIARDAELKIEEIASKMHPNQAEITEGSCADWYLVRTYPGDDMRALRWLARRRFGVFRPMQQRRLKRNGERLVQGLEPVFPGWLFVFCWDAVKMRARIESAPGVMKVLCYPDTDQPVAISQGFVDRLRALSWIYDERAPRPGHFTVSAGRHAKKSTRPRRDKKTRKAAEIAHKMKKELKRQGKFDPSTWEEANKLAPAERIRLLQRALNGPAVVGVISSGCGG